MREIYSAVRENEYAGYRIGEIREVLAAGSKRRKREVKAGCDGKGAYKAGKCNGSREKGWGGGLE